MSTTTDDHASARATIQAKLVAIRTQAYGPEPRVEEAAPAHRHNHRCHDCHCCCRGRSTFWDFYMFDRLTSSNNRTASSSASPQKNGSSEKDWVAFLVMLVLSVCAAIVAVNDIYTFVVLLRMIREADALILPMGGRTSVAFDAWKTNELVHWFAHSFSLCLFALITLAATVCLAFDIGDGGIIYYLGVPVFLLAISQFVYHILGRREANRALLNEAIATLVKAD